MQEWLVSRTEPSVAISLYSEWLGLEPGEYCDLLSEDPMILANMAAKLLEGDEA